MGIKLQSATLSEPFEYISLHDSAMDTEAEGFADEFQKYREGTIDAPPLKPGEKPTIWTLAPIADARLKAMLDGVREEHGRAAWAVMTAAFGIKSVSNLADHEGKPFRIQHDYQDGFPKVISDQLNAIGAEVLNELGMVILTHQSPS